MDCEVKMKNNSKLICPAIYFHSILAISFTFCEHTFFDSQKSMNLTTPKKILDDAASAEFFYPELLESVNNFKAQGVFFENQIKQKKKKNRRSKRKRPPKSNPQQTIEINTIQQIPNQDNKTTQHE